VRGQELRAIRDSKLYRSRYNFATFEEYCDQRWEVTEARASQLISAAAFGEVLTLVKLQLPSRETHIRPLLSRLEVDDDRIAVWGDVLASTNGAKIKAADVDDAISRFIALRDKEYVTLAEWRELDERELRRRSGSAKPRAIHADAAQRGQGRGPVRACEASTARVGPLGNQG
jgi:hypothetical protein